MIIRLHTNDNVVIAKSDIPAGEQIESVVARVDIPAGHKVAVGDIPKGEAILKYNQEIGVAAQNIPAGAHVHSHNVEIRQLDQEYEVGVDACPTKFIPKYDQATFEGFYRADGNIGTRNYIGILTSVNCSASVARCIAEEVERSDILKAYPSIDGIVALMHGSGCGMQAGSEGHDILKRVLAGYIRNPNFGAILMVGLGCEVNQIGDFIKENNLEQNELFQVMNIQDEGGTRETIDKGVDMVCAMMPMVGAAKRQKAPASALTLALQCGGSDAYSGITANPALGLAADMLVRHGGTAILSETPEIYGAEHLLIKRAVDQKISDKLLNRIQWWEDYTANLGGEMNNNPSPGNKAGGLTTIFEKSLGAVAKAGTTNLIDVYEYAEPVTQKGFVFMDSPGNDPVSVTGQVASGANMVCFTTGRGSVFGFKPVPSIKIATNSAVYKRMTEDMDINAGEIVDGTASLEEMGDRIFQYILEVASGKKSLSEELGIGSNEFVPWQIGAVM